VVGSVVGITEAGGRAVVPLDPAVVVGPSCGFFSAVLLLPLHAAAASTTALTTTHWAAVTARRAPAVLG
jgi:hypothetical protein